jgi:hypothetical protein
VAAALGELIQAQDAVARQRHLARHRHVAPADQPDIRDGEMGGPKGTGGDSRRAVPDATGDAVEAHGLKGLGAGHRRPDGSEPPGQHRFTQLWRAE